MTTLAVGIDLGGTKLLGALVDDAGKVLERREEPTRAERGPEAVVASMATLALALEKAGGTVVGVGVGAPGPVDPESGVVWAMPNLGAGWRRYPIRDALRKALPGKRVEVENDANVAMAGEAWVGSAAGSLDAVMLTLGTGVGGGIISGGCLVRGHRGVGAEIGHIVVEREGHPCGCGGRGCLEQYASGTAVTRLAVDALARGDGGSLAHLGRAPTGIDVLAAARAGDEVARGVIELAAEALGVGLVSIVHMLNPEVIVVGGGFGTASFDLVVPIAKARLASRSFEASREGLRVVPAKLGADAGAVGAARSALDSARRT